MAQEKLVTIEPSFVDDRGSIINVFARKGVKGAIWANVPLVTIIHTEKGAVRGNHYHKAEWQYCYVVKGAFRSTSTDVRPVLSESPGISGEYRRIDTWTVREGQLIMTPPYVAHRYEFLEDTILLCGVTANRLSMDQDDTYPYEVVP